MKLTVSRLRALKVAHRILLALYEAPDVPDGSAERALARAMNPRTALMVSEAQYEAANAFIHGIAEG